MNRGPAMRVFVLGLALVAGPAWGQAAPNTDQATLMWQGCVFKAAEQWAKTSERADVIASGAVGACTKAESYLSKKLAEEGIGEAALNSIIESSKRKLREQAIARVLESRSGIKGPLAR